MAVPSLAAMAALTLFHNPHVQPEDVSIDYTPYAAPATVIQRRARRRNLLNRAATRINALIRAFSVRTFIAGLGTRTHPRLTPRRFLLYGFRPGHTTSMEDGHDVWAHVRDLMGQRDMRYGRHYYSQRRRAFGLGPTNPNLVLFQVGSAP